MALSFASVAIALGLAACAGDSFGSSSDDAAATEASTSDASGEASGEASSGDDGRAPNDAPASGDGRVDADTGADTGACPPAKGSPQVRVGAFCIDTTEVTVAEYSDFLAALVPTTGQGDFCDWNQSFQPAMPPRSFDTPITAIDWCDAVAYCRWAGKRLCGNVNGGPLALIDMSSPKDEWFVACAGDAGEPYPYGSMPDPARCNTAEQDAGIRPVGSSTGCAGSAAGLFDMSGNAYEWIDRCTPDAAPDAAKCSIRGGSCQTAVAQASCAAEVGLHPAETYGDVGFRCCSAAP